MEGQGVVASEGCGAAGTVGSVGRHLAGWDGWGRAKGEDPDLSGWRFVTETWPAVVPKSGVYPSSSCYARYCYHSY